MRFVYQIQVPIRGSETWFDLAEAQTPESAGELVRILLSKDVDGPMTIRIDKRYREDSGNANVETSV